MDKIERTFYLCNGKRWCSKRKDGRKNEYCYINALDTDYCHHTLDPEFRKHKDEGVFDVVEHTENVDGKELYFVDKWEIDRMYGDSVKDHFRRKCDMKMQAEMDLIKNGGIDE